MNLIKIYCHFFRELVMDVMQDKLKAQFSQQADAAAKSS